MRRAVGVLGRILIGFGLLTLLFVAYQLWGTGLHEARAQHDLRKAFRAELSAVPTTTPAQAGEPTTTTEVPPVPPIGNAVAVLRIPRIGVDKAVVEGVGVPDLKKGPGHYPGTPLPGQPGNAAIAGHRTTYGAPFYRLNEVGPGDLILVSTRQGNFRYRVVETRVVKPSQTEVLRPTLAAMLTLTTCNPRFSASQRLVVSAVLTGDPAPAPPPTTVPAGTRAAPRVAFDPPSLSGDRAAAMPTIVWGLLVAIAGIAIWQLSRRWRRWWAYLLGAPVFVVLLFIFFENIARLLPANI